MMGALEFLRLSAAVARRVCTCLVALSFLQASTMEAEGGWVVFQLVMGLLMLVATFWPAGRRRQPESLVGVMTAGALSPNEARRMRR